VAAGALLRVLWTNVTSTTFGDSKSPTSIKRSTKIDREPVGEQCAGRRAGNRVRAPPVGVAERLEFVAEIERTTDASHARRHPPRRAWR